MKQTTWAVTILAVFALGCAQDKAKDAGNLKDAGDANAGATDASEAGVEPGRGVWNELADLPSGAVQETAVVALDGRVYVLGGIDGTRGTVADVLVYDLAAKTWLADAAPALPMPVHHANASVVAGTIYVTGALLAQFAPIGNVWAYKPGDDRWTERSGMEAARARGASVVGVIDGLIYVAGGLGENGASVAHVSRYDPALDSWDDTLPDLPMRLDHAAGQAVGNALYVIGGRSDGIGKITNAVHAYVDGSWQLRAAMLTARGGSASGIVNGAIVVVGGEGNADQASGVFAAAERYDPKTDRWTTLTPMPRPRHGMAAVGVGDTLYVPGGADVMAFGAVATFDTLTLE